MEVLTLVFPVQIHFLFFYMKTKSVNFIFNLVDLVHNITISMLTFAKGYPFGYVTSSTFSCLHEPNGRFSSLMPSCHRPSPVSKQGDIFLWLDVFYEEYWK